VGPRLYRPAIGELLADKPDMRAAVAFYLIYVCGIVFLAVLTFRAVTPTLLALIPLAVGSFWTLGFMGLFQVTFNVANLMVLPLIMAPAVESGIMIVYRSREERRKSPRPVPLPKSTGQAVGFSALSTIVGFGSLMISRHGGILSIGLLLTFGVASVLLASVTVLPSLLALLSSRRGEKGDVEPATEDRVARICQQDLDDSFTSVASTGADATGIGGGES